MSPERPRAAAPMDTSELFATYVGYADILFRLGGAAAIGFVVGLDRELKGKTLGPRTNMLVAIGAALFGIVASELGGRHESMDVEAVRFDRSRVVEGIITGIGFLGAGAIIRGRRDISGGTTAACVWVLGGIGLACGLGLVALALIAGALLVLVLTVLHAFTASRGGRKRNRAAEDGRRAAAAQAASTGSHATSLGRPFA